MARPHLQPVLFTFPDATRENVFRGYADGTTWNGFDNVWVTPQVRDQVADFTAYEARQDYGALDPDMEEVVDDLISAPTDESGLVSLAGGYATQVSFEGGAGA